VIVVALLVAKAVAPYSAVPSEDSESTDPASTDTAAAAACTAPEGPGGELERGDETRDGEERKGRRPKHAEAMWWLELEMVRRGARDAQTAAPFACCSDWLWQWAMKMRLRDKIDIERWHNLFFESNYIFLLIEKQFT
jgi:hypothetical protein